jgi:hypothetical protein
VDHEALEKTRLEDDTARESGLRLFTGCELVGRVLFIAPGTVEGER